MDTDVDPLALAWLRRHQCDARTPAQQHEDYEASLDRLRLRAGRMTLAELRAAGFRLWLEGGTLRVNGTRMNDDAAALVERMRDELVIALREDT